MVRYAFTGPTSLSMADEQVTRAYIYSLPEPEGVVTGGARGFDCFVAGVCLRRWPNAVHEIFLPNAPFDAVAVERLGGQGAHVVTVVAGEEGLSAAYRARNRTMVERAGPEGELHAGLRSPAFYRSGEWMTVNIARELGVHVSKLLLPGDHASRANALYEELRKLERPELDARYATATGKLPYAGKQGMIAEIIETELAGQPL